MRVIDRYIQNKIAQIAPFRFLLLSFSLSLSLICSKNYSKNIYKKIGKLFFPRVNNLINIIDNSIHTGKSRKIVVCSATIKQLHFILKTNYDKLCRDKYLCQHYILFISCNVFASFKLIFNQSNFIIK